MCTTSRMIYILTYRALREFANGRKSVNPIEEMHRMETCVPFSVCGKTHDVMIKAQRSFNQRCQKPAIIHECLYECRGKEMCGWPLHKSRCNGASWLTSWDTDKIHDQLLIERNRAYARKVNGFWNYRLYKIDTKASWLKVMRNAALSA